MSIPQQRAKMNISYMPRWIIYLSLTAITASSSWAIDTVSCNAAFTVCSIPENALLQLPFAAIAGDVIVQESASTTVSDVFRVFNNLVDTGGGTGLGNLVLLYSSDDTQPLPSPSTYSANAVIIKESAAGATSYVGNGTNYILDTAAVPAPSFSKSFSPNQVALGGTSTLTFTIANNDGVAVAGLAFTDPLPAGVAIASPSNLTNTCGGVAVASTNSVSLTGGVVNPPLGTTCSVSVSVVGQATGVKVNTTSPLTSTNAPTVPPATATLTVVAPPTISKSFGTGTLAVGGTTSLSFSITNPNGVVLTGVAFADVLPAGLRVATPNGLTNSCGGTVTAVAGSSSISLAGGTIAAGGSCAVGVNVTAVAEGVQNNATSGVSSTEGGTGNAATASITVIIPFEVSYTSNLNVGDGVINISNNGANGAALASGTTAATTGAICANVYAFSPDEQMISCCSCAVTPNGLVSLSARSDLISNTFTPAVPTAIVVKVLATLPVSGSCVGSAASSTTPIAPGMEAWGTSLHAAPVAGTYAVTETPFVRASLSNSELNRLKSLCTFIVANGSGFGVCRSCRLGGLGSDKQ